MDNERYFDMIQDYLDGDLNAAEKIAFETQLEQDEDLKRTFEQHQLLAEGVRLNALEAQRERLRKIQAEIETEDNQEATTLKVESRSNMRQILSIAAVLLIGLFAGNFLKDSFQSGEDNPTADIINNNSSTEDLYGNLTDDLPFFESMVPLVKGEITDSIYQESASSIVFSILECKSCERSFKWDNNQLVLFDQAPQQKKYNSPLEIKLIRKVDENLKLATLKAAGQSIQIPLNNETFEILWNK